jgi:hypothetical protein
MIAKGRQHNNGSKLAAYLTHGKDGEIAELYQLRGFGTNTNIKDAFRDIHVMAGATKATQPFFHLQMRLPGGETLPREKWEHCAGRIERMLGLKDQPRAIAFHIDRETGEEHMHVAWSRIRMDGEKLTAIPLPFYKTRLKNLCRELEQELGLTQVKNERDSKIDYAPTRNEDQQARRLDVDVHAIRETVRACYDHCDGGRAFQAALAEEGLILAQGDRRDYLVVHPAGGFLALGKRLLDVSAAQVRGRLADLDRTQLPTLEQAREQMLARDLVQIEDAQRETRDRLKEMLAEIDHILISPEKWRQEQLQAREQELARDRAQIEEANLNTRDKLKAMLAEIDQLTAGHNWDRDGANAAWEEAIIKAAIEHGPQEPAADPKIDLVRFRMDADYRRQCEALAAQQIDKEQQQYAKTARYAASVEAARRDFEEMCSRADTELGKTTAAIRLAYNLADGPRAFKEALEQVGLTAARLTREDIAERDSTKKEENRDAAIRGWNAAKAEFLDPDRNLTPAAESERPTPSRRLSDHAREGDVVILERCPARAGRKTAQADPRVHRPATWRPCRSANVGHAPRPRRRAAKARAAAPRGRTRRPRARQQKGNRR